MSDIICVLLTSNGCGHCHAFRGDGLINNGKNYMAHEYIKSLMTISKQPTSIINVHYENMSGASKFITDISKFSYTSQGILQERYFKYQDKPRLRTILSSNGKNKDINIGDVKSKGQQISWDKFVSEKVPSQLQNYAFYFPCFLVLNKSSWKEALQGPSKSLLALANAGFTIEKDGQCQLDKNGVTLRQRNVDIKDLLSQIAKGETKIEVHRKEENTPSTKEEKHTRKNIDHDFVIKSYDE